MARKTSPGPEQLLEQTPPSPPTQEPVSSASPDSEDLQAPEDQDPLRDLPDLPGQDEEE